MVYDFLYIWSLLGDAEFSSRNVGVLERRGVGGWSEEQGRVGKLLHCAKCGIFEENIMTGVLRLKN